MRGRPPKPTEQKRREGNAGKRKLPPPGRSTRPGGPGSDPDWLPPAALGADGLELWVSVVPRLRHAGILDTVDRAALELMCVAWSLVCRSRRVIAEEGTVAEGSMGQPVEHPAIATYAKASAQFLRYAEQFGMTASARARLDMAGADPPDELKAALGESPRLVALRGGKR